MLEALRFVQGAIQKNGITPELEHYQIKNGHVVGFNGYMALSSPIDLTIEALPKATLFHKALQACGDSIAIDTTPAGRLHIKSGNFSAYIPCIERDVYEAKPRGTVYPVAPGLAKTFARMLPFIADDATRPWAMGLSIGGGCYTATNNVILLQVWDGHQMPTFNCPRFAVAEVARIRQDPVSIQICADSVTFHFENGRWLRSQLLEQGWPVEKMNSVLERAPDAAAPLPLPEGFFDAIETLAPFAESPMSPIFTTAAGLSTGRADSQEGASVRMMGLPDAAFRLKALMMLRGEIDAIDLTRHPLPCHFFGPNSRGALIGMSF